MKNYFYIVFMLISMYVHAQPQWINYANDFIISDIEWEGNDLWVCTQGGLVKIDTITRRKETFQAWNSGLRGTGVTELEISHDGTKWIGGENGGLFKYDRGKWEQYYYINTGDTLVQIQELKLDADGNPWFFSNINGNCQGCRKLISYDGDKFLNHDTQIDKPGNGGWLRDLEINKSGDVWVSIVDRLVLYDGEKIIQEFDKSDLQLDSRESLSYIEIYENETLYLVISGYGDRQSYSRLLKYDGVSWKEEIKRINGTVIRFFQGDDGSLWVTTNDTRSNTRHYVSLKQGVWEYWTQDDIDSIPGAFNPPQLMNVDENGNWWVSSYSEIHNSKVFKLVHSSYSSYNTEIIPLSTNYYDHVVADCDNNIWALGNKDLSQFDGQNWTNLQKNQTGLHGAARSSMLNTSTCDIWISIYNNDVNSIDLVQYDGKEFIDHDIANYGIIDIDFGSDGSLYAATRRSGVCRYNQGNKTYYNENNSPINSFVFSVKVQKDGTMWASSYDKGVVKMDQNGWAVFDTSNSPIEQYTAYIFKDNLDQIWVGIDGGLAKYNGSDWDEYSLGLDQSEIMCMYQDQSGNYWLGTKKYGAIYWDGRDLTPYDVSNSNIGSNFVKDIYVDTINNDVWFVHSIGMSVLRDYEIVSTKENESGAKISIFPNPTSEKIKVQREKEGIQSQWSATLFDVSGNLIAIQSTMSDELTIDLPTQGVYVLHINDGQRSQNHKVVRY